VPPLQTQSPKQQGHNSRYTHDPLLASQLMIGLVTFVNKGFRILKLSL
jgi:hypothetical protein